MNAHGYALGQPNPLEGRADRRQHVKAGTAVILGNAPAQAVDATLKGFIALAHEGEDRPVALADAFDIVFLEKPDNPVALDIHQRQ